MNLDFQDQDYYPKPSKQSFNRTRGNLKPAKLPFPLKSCNYEELRDYLGIELLQHHNKDLEKLAKRFLYGNAKFKPVFWPDTWSWPTVQRFSKKYTGPGEAVDMFRLIARLLLLEYGLDGDIHYDQNCNKETLKKREGRPEKAVALRRLRLRLLPSSPVLGGLQLQPSSPVLGGLRL